MQQVTSDTVLPVLVSSDDPAYQDGRHVFDAYYGQLLVGYTIGPALGESLLTLRDFEKLDTTRRDLRRWAATCLDRMVDVVELHGQPPALMLSFGGIESSLVLADAFWDGLAGAVPGDVVIGVPARDVVILTGSGSASGIAKARRAVDRVFFAGGPHLLLRDLLVRKDGEWEIYSGR